MWTWQGVVYGDHVMIWTFAWILNMMSTQFCIYLTFIMMLFNSWSQKEPSIPILNFFLWFLMEPLVFQTWRQLFGFKKPFIPIIFTKEL